MSALILPWQGVWPVIAPSAWIAPTAVITGDVGIGEQAGIWFGVVIRGDDHQIRIGARTNIQDGTIVHATRGLAGTFVGEEVTVGHAAVLHACRLGFRSLVGMGALVLDEAELEPGAMLAAGAVLPPGKRVPAGELWAGNPARKLRDLSPGETAGIADSAARYVANAEGYREGSRSVAEGR